MPNEMLSTNQAAEYLGVTGKTLKEWDYSGYFKPTLYTEGGHRRYSKEDLDSFLRNEQKAKYASDEVEKDIMRAMTMYAKGVMSLVNILEDPKRRESAEDLPPLWKKASILLHQISYQHGINNFIFPLTVNEQYALWKTPLYQWDIKLFDKLFAKSLYDEPVLYDYGVTDYCMELSQMIGNEPGEITEFKSILEEVRQNGESNEYTKIRAFIIEHPIISQEDLDFHLLTQFTGNLKKYRLRIHNLYEDIPQEYISRDGYFNKCPYCGWTLRKNLNKSIIVNTREDYTYICNTDKCRTHATEWKIGETLLAQNYVRVKPGIQKFIVEPGIAEIRLYKEVLKLFNEKFGEESTKMITLYPECDLADISITFKNGVKWVIDVKDWVFAQGLAMVLNEKEMFSAFPNNSFERGILAVPASYGRDYIDILKARWNESDNYDVVNIKQLMRELRESLGVS